MTKQRSKFSDAVDELRRVGPVFNDLVDGFFSRLGRGIGAALGPAVRRGLDAAMDRGPAPAKPRKRRKRR